MARCLLDFAAAIFDSPFKLGTCSGPCCINFRQARHNGFPTLVQGTHSTFVNIELRAVLRFDVALLARKSFEALLLPLKRPRRLPHAQESTGQATPARVCVGLSAGFASIFLHVA